MENTRPNTFNYDFGDDRGGIREVEVLWNVDADDELTDPQDRIDEFSWEQKGRHKGGRLIQDENLNGKDIKLFNNLREAAFEAELAAEKEAEAKRLAEEDVGVGGRKRRRKRKSKRKFKRKTKRKRKSKRNTKRKTKRKRRRRRRR